MDDVKDLEEFTAEAARETPTGDLVSVIAESSATRLIAHTLQRMGEQLGMDVVALSGQKPRVEALKAAGEVAQQELNRRFPRERRFPYH